MMDKRILLQRLSMFGFLALTGCAGSTYSSHFDCPYGTGAGCASLSKVNKMIDRNEIKLNEEDSAESISENKQVLVYFGPDKMSKLISIEPFSKGERT